MSGLDSIKSFLFTQRPKFAAVGDLHGSIDLFTERVRGVLDAGVEIEKTPLVFLGDIIGDRKATGTEILKRMFHFRQQLPSSQREDMIQYIIGNHDLWILAFFIEALNLHFDGNSEKKKEDFIRRSSRMFFTGYPCLLQKEGAPIGEMEEAVLGRMQGKGLVEFAHFLPYDKEVNLMEPGEGLIRTMTDSIASVIENMRKSTEGKMIVSELCSSRLCSQIGDTLFIHTPPTQNAIEWLEIRDFDFDSINYDWQSRVKRIFSAHKGISESLPYFEGLFGGLLDTDNRFQKGGSIEKYRPFTSRQAKLLQQKGIRRIVYGHEYSSSSFPLTIDGIQLVGVDYAYDPKSFLGFPVGHPNSCSVTARV